VLEIFRVWNNFIGPPKSKKPTPAHRLGLTKGKVRYEDIVYFDVRDYLKPTINPGAKGGTPDSVPQAT
jgi:hypothetical protein